MDRTSDLGRFFELTILAIVSFTPSFLFSARSSYIASDVVPVVVKRSLDFP